MDSVDTRRRRLRQLIADAPGSDEALRAVLVALVDEIDRAHRRVSELELALARLAGTVPMTDDVEIGRSSETTA